ncbi:MAG: hypothetical protein WCX97_01420 [Candidatus Magasanikbacteria bacterium]
MSKKIAIDVVLLLPPKVSNLSIKVNNKALKNGCKGVLLNKKDNLPHISLFMGVINQKDINLIGEKIKITVKNFSPIVTAITKLNSAPHADGLRMYDFSLKNNKQFQLLHETVVKGLKKFVCGKAISGMFYKDKGEILTGGWNWVNNFIKNASFKNFYPHITLRTSCASYNKFPVRFTASRLVICHLGDHCTCRKILWETELK